LQASDDAAVVAPGADTGAETSCPSCEGVIVMKDRWTGPQHGDPNTGTAYADDCPENQVVTGYRGSLLDPPASDLSSVLTLCGELAIGTAGVGEVQVLHIGTLPERGRHTSATWEQSCPANSIVTGVIGHSGAVVDQIKFQCSRLILSGTGSEGYVVSLDPAMIELNPPIGGTGGSPFQVSCPIGQVTRGSNVRAQDSVNAFGLICGTPSFAPAGTFQAEDASLAGGTFVNTNHADYTGTGYVDGYWSAGAMATFSVDVESDEPREAILRYANGLATTQTLTVYVNGSRALQTSLSPHGSWDVWTLKTELLNLRAGANAIAYKYDPSDSGHVNLDALIVVK
jgi:hypothetical protein